MKWKNLKTDPPEQDTLLLVRYMLAGKEDKEEIRISKYHKGKKDGSYYIVDGVKHTDYLGSGNGQWQFHFASADFYYIPIDELKQLETQ